MTHRLLGSRSGTLPHHHYRFSRPSSATAATGIVSFGFMISWVLPYHTYPYWSFYNDYAALLGVTIGLLLFYSDEKRTAAVIPRAMVLPFGLAAIVAVDAATGRMWAPREAVIPIGYLTLASLAMLLGRNLVASGVDGDSDRNRVFDTFCSALIAAGLLSAVITYCQYLGIDDRLGDWSVAIGSDGVTAIRPYANLGQPNQLALILCWSLAALWRTFVRGTMSGFIMIVLAVLLLASLALTQSKVAWLITPFLVLLVWFGNGRQGARKVGPVALVALVSIFIAIVLLLPYLSNFLGTVTEDLNKRMETNGVRSVMILEGLYIGLQHPFAGVGWSGFGAGQIAVAPLFGDTQYAMHAHDFIANLAAETGWLVTLVVVVAIATWCYRRYVKHSMTINTLFALMVFTALAIHSLVEFPLWYAYILLPTAFLVGLTDCELAITSRLTAKRLPIVVTCLVAALLMTGIATDYRRVVQAFRALGMQKIGFTYPNGSTAEPEWTFFPHFYGYIAFADLQPTVGMTPEAITNAERVAGRFGYAPVLMRLATIYALNDRGEDAVRLVTAMRRLYPQRYRETYEAWRTLGREYPAVLGRVFEQLPKP